MGLLVPENFPMRSLANSEERLVVEALRDHRAGLAHASKCGRPVQLDLPGLAQ